MTDNPYAKYKPQPRQAGENPYAKYVSKPNLIERIGQDFSGMVQKAGEAKQREALGQQSSNETVLQGLGNSANFIFGQVPGQAIGSALSYLPEPVKELGRNAGTAIASIPLGSLGTVGEVSSDLARQYQDFEQSNPRAAANIGAVAGLGNAALALTPIKGTSLASALAGGTEKGLKVAGKGIKATGNAIEAVTPKPKPVLSSDVIRSQASAKYKSATDLGGVLKPEFTNSFIDDLQTVLPQTKAGKAIAGQSEVSALVDRMQALRDSPLNLDEVQEIDEYLGDLADKFTEMGRPTKEGVKILDIQSELRNRIENAPETAIVGGKEGFDALKQARKEWSVASRAREIEKILARAEMTDNPQTAIKTGMRTLYNNPKRIRGFTPEQKELIKKAAEGGIGVDMLRIMASRLNPIAAGALGGIGGAAASFATSEAARGAATMVQAQKAKKVLQSLTGELTTKDILKMPPKEASKLLTKGKK